jgi:hypothetical protein
MVNGGLRCKGLSLGLHISDASDQTNRTASLTPLLKEGVMIDTKNNLTTGVVP